MARGRVVAGVVATLAALGCIGAAPAGAAVGSSPTWQVVYQTAKVQITEVVATGPTDAWAIGLTTGRVPSGVLLHWNGTSWRWMNYPGSKSFLPMDVYPLSATDVWLGQYSTVQPTSMLHWSHGHWSTLALPVNAEPMLVLADNDVWIDTQGGGPGTACPFSLKPGTYCVTTAHWNGTHWTNYRLAASALLTASASSRYDLWAVGDVDERQTKQGSTFEPAIFHWTGSSWRRIPLSSPRIDWTPSIVAYSTSDVYVDENSTADPSACAMHWTASGWKPLYLTGSGAPCQGTFTTDYGRGLWLSSPPTAEPGFIFVHWTGKVFVTAPAFVPGSDYTGEVTAAAVPRSKSLWLFGNYCLGLNKCVEKGTIALLH